MENTAQLALPNTLSSADYTRLHTLRTQLPQQTQHRSQDSMTGHTDTTYHIHCTDNRCRSSSWDTGGWEAVHMRVHNSNRLQQPYIAHAQLCSVRLPRHGTPSLGMASVAETKPNRFTETGYTQLQAVGRSVRLACVRQTIRHHKIHQ